MVFDVVSFQVKHVHTNKTVGIFFDFVYVNLSAMKLFEQANLS